MTQEKTIIEWAPILHLPPVNTEQMEPHALQQYLEFFLEVHRAVPILYLLSDEDLRLFLSDTEYARLRASVDEIKGWLQKCNKDNDEATLMVYPYSSVIRYYMSDLKALVKRAYERKVEKERQETIKRRRLAALEEINPPLDDAKKYLSDHEYQQFCDSVPGAIDAYLGRDKRAESYSPPIWLLNRKASHYSYWTSVIKERKEKEVRHKRAELQHSQFRKEINDTIKEFRLELAKEKKPKFAYPLWLAGYHPNLWCELTTPTKENIEDWAKPQIQQRVPSALTDFVSWELSWQVQTLPEAKYEVLGVPCLTWWFTVLILVKVHLRLAEKEFTKDFEGYSYKVRLGAEDLGSFYLGPVLGGHREGFSTPIALLFLLGKGELEAPSIAVTDRSSPFTTFAVQGFEEETLEVHDAFRRFIKDIAKEQPLAQALLAKGLIDQDTAKLIEEKAKLPLLQLVGAQASAMESTVDNSDVKAAIEVLGYKKKESEKAIEAAHLSPSMSLEEKVKAVLKILGGNFP